MGRGRAPRIDLHCHTSRSDGRFDWAQALQQAADQGLALFAITDHDLPPAEPPAAPRLIEATELTAEHGGHELHLLVYFGAGMPPAFRAWLHGRASERARRYDAIVGQLGLPLPPADDAAHRGERALTRHHLARALVDAGHAATFSRAMALLATVRPPSLGLPFVEAVAHARAAGGLTVWAHPPLDVAQASVATFASAGLDGLEVHKPRAHHPTRNGLARLCKQHGLLASGGSDWHGWTEGALGLYSLPDEAAWAFLDRLERRAAAA